MTRWLIASNLIPTALIRISPDMSSILAFINFFLYFLCWAHSPLGLEYKGEWKKQKSPFECLFSQSLIIGGWVRKVHNTSSSWMCAKMENNCEWVRQARVARKSKNVAQGPNVNRGITSTLLLGWHLGGIYLVRNKNDSSYCIPLLFRFFCRTISHAALKTNLTFSVSVAHVKCG